MSKTFYIGHTKGGALIGRGSTQRDYTHAALRNPERFEAGNVVPPSAANFSRSAAGALKLASQYAKPTDTVEAVELQQVDGATYRNLIGRS